MQRRQYCTNGHCACIMSHLEHAWQNKTGKLWPNEQRLLLQKILWNSLFLMLIYLFGSHCCIEIILTSILFKWLSFRFN